MEQPPSEDLSASARKSLARFLQRNRDRVITQWVHAVRAIPAAVMLDAEELRDHIPSLIARVLALVEAPGNVPVDDLAEAHAVGRLRAGFNLEQVAWEYSALRSTLLRLNDEQKALEPGAVVLLNDVIDQAVVTAVAKFHRARVRMLEALDRIDQEGLLAESEWLGKLLHRLLQVIMDTVEEVDTAVLFLRDWDRLVVWAAAGLEKPIEGQFSLAIGEGFAGAVAQSRRPLLTHSAASDPRVRNPILRMSGVKALYGVPLVFGDDLIGVAKMGSRTVSDFAADDRQILRSAAERAAAFIAQKRETEDRDLLLHMLGHDLRSPLSTITMSTSMARQSAHLPPDVVRTLERVDSAAQRMSRLIHDLTDYTQTRAMGHLTIHRERLDLREIVGTPVRDIAARCGREVRLDIAGDVTGEFDRGRIERVVVNLLNNALAYGAPGTPISVRVEGTADAVTIDVHNEGDPIPADLGPRLFDKFKRGERGGGSGLGLFIVQRIARAHGGSVEFASSAERGTTFSVRLPRRAEQQAILDASKNG